MHRSRNAPACHRCHAFDRHIGALCSQPTSDNSKWCAQHEELQAKLLKSYKRLTFRAEAFDDTLIPSLEDIKACEELRVLQEHTDHVRAKWILYNRARLARQEHHDVFYHGGDQSHCLFVNHLDGATKELETLLRELDSRAYTLLLAPQAGWVLTQPRLVDPCAEVTRQQASCCEGDQVPCERPSPSKPVPTRRKVPVKKKRSLSMASDGPRPVDEQIDELPSQVKTTRKINPETQLRVLREWLTPPADLPNTVSPDFYSAFADGVFRHVVLNTPGLARLALDPPRGIPVASVGDFCELLEERVEGRLKYPSQVGDLWSGIKLKDAGPNEERKLLTPGILSHILASLDIASSPSREPGCDSVRILGGVVYAHAAHQPLSRQAWDLFYQFVPCIGCLLSVMPSFETWTELRSLAALGWYPAWYAGKGESDRVLHLAGAVKVGGNVCCAGKTLKRVESKTNEAVAKATRSGKGGKKTVYIEEWQRAYLHLKLPLGKQGLVERLQQQFDVISRPGTSSAVTAHSPTPPSRHDNSRHYWICRVRSGFSVPARKAAGWTTTRFFDADTVLDSLAETCPDRRHGCTFDDYLDVLVMDTRAYEEKDDGASFAELVAAAVLEEEGSYNLPSLRATALEKAISDGAIVPSGGCEEINTRGTSTAGRFREA